MTTKEQATKLLKDWKKDEYIFGLGVLDQIGEIAKRFGKKALVVSNYTYLTSVADQVMASLKESGIELLTPVPVPDAKPNAPKEDVYRIESYILHHQPDFLVAIGGGSSIDACKGAAVLATYGKEVTSEIDHYFGTNLVTEAQEKTGKKLLPILAIETSASSGSHLTKYANITNPVEGQKKLIVDNAVTPVFSMFDYQTTVSMPLVVSIDGALDAIAHTFEVFCGAKAETFEITKQLAVTAIDLVLENTKKLIENPNDLEAREAVGLATDLGGYAIMIGGTSGAHLTSFSLVDLVAHGTACGIMNPYYAVFYAPAIAPQLEVIGEVFAKYGFLSDEDKALTGAEKAKAVANAMIAFGKSIGAPTTLGELKGFTAGHVDRILSAAKDPQLKMKLQNMPIPMTADDVDTYMAPIIEAAVTGDVSGIICK